MTQWYSVATPGETERLVGAWADAPIENEEWCGFILEVARERVLEYAPVDIPSTFEPATLEWPNGQKVTLSRVGEVVTADIDMSSVTGALDGTAMPYLAAHFSPFGTVELFWQKVVEYMAVISESAISFLPINPHIAPWPSGTAKWLADPADGDGIPIRYVVAQLQQATNLWNAGRVSGSGDVGVDQFTYTPRPLDKTIKGIIRPQTGRPRVR